MLIVNDRIAIPLEEFEISHARSSGPGGQNVNKVHSKVILRWNPATSPSLPPSVQSRLLDALESRLTKDGDLLITSQRTADQSRNLADCLDKLRNLIFKAAEPPRPRRPTRPTQASRVKRIEAKSRRSETKKLRRKPQAEE